MMPALGTRGDGAADAAPDRRAALMKLEVVRSFPRHKGTSELLNILWLIGWYRDFNLYCLFFNLLVLSLL